MKKLLCFLLLATMLFSMTACGDQTLPTTTPAASTPAVTDKPTEPTNPTTAPVEITAPELEILTDMESYTVTVGAMVPIVATFDGVSTGLTFASGNETIATVNKYGKVVGVKAGETEVTITAPNGTVKIVSVTVEGPKYENVLRVCLNVLYNDTELGCFNTEYGPYVEIYEDGTYTVTFDCTMHLSESTRLMGVEDLSNLTAIFLYDYEVRKGNQMYSSVTACDIRWDSVVVNGVELTLTNSEFKSAIKATGIFDTNDPLNAWDGSSVEEVTVDSENHVLNINMEDPVTITITFTIQGLTFAD